MPPDRARAAGGLGGLVHAGYAPRGLPAHAGGAPHCIEGTPGWALYGRVADLRREEDVCFCKGALGSRELLLYLSDHPVEEIELCGLVSNMCVLSNAVVCKAALPECRVAVNEALTRSFDPALHAKAMDVLRGVQIDVLGGGDADAH